MGCWTNTAIQWFFQGTDSMKEYCGTAKSTRKGWGEGQCLLSVPPGGRGPCLQSPKAPAASSALASGLGEERGVAWGSRDEEGDMGQQEQGGQGDMGHGDRDDMLLPASESLELSLGCAGVSALELIKGEGKTVARPICRPKWKNLCLASGFFDSSGLVKIPATLGSCLAG